MQFVLQTTTSPQVFSFQAFVTTRIASLFNPSTDTISRISPNRRYLFRSSGFRFPLSKELSIPLVVFEIVGRILSVTGKSEPFYRNFIIEDKEVELADTPKTRSGLQVLSLFLRCRARAWTTGAGTSPPS